jgi:hypothetical protein
MKIGKDIGLNVRLIATTVFATFITFSYFNSIAQSSDFPIKPIKSIIYPTGGSSDLLARIMGISNTMPARRSILEFLISELKVALSDAIWCVAGVAPIADLAPKYNRSIAIPAQALEILGLRKY